MKNKMPVIATVIGACVLSTTLCAQSPLPKSNNQVDMLFLQQSNSGHLHALKDRNGCYDLILDGLHHDILYFTNTPNRSAGYLTVSQLVTTLNHNQLVEKLQPNGVLHAHQQIKGGAEKEIDVVGTLSNARYEKKQFHYTLCVIGDNKQISDGKLRKVNLFVDPIHRWPP